jgi:GntR family transcriptional regulator, transcriptional repressor for pyruvate dehydrogenase complex
VEQIDRLFAARAPVVSGANFLADRLREEILEARHPPGTRLYNLRELQERSGYSLSVVREALQLLQASGLITVRQGAKGGVFVRQADHDVLTQSLGALMVTNNISHAALIESRQELEGVCASLAARHATVAQLAELRGSVDITSGLVTDPARFSLENVRFHRLISEATGNDVIIAVSAALSELFFKETVNINYSESALRATVRAHNRIVKAVAENDRDGARTAMMKHVSGYDEYLSQTDQQSRRRSR